MPSIEEDNKKTILVSVLGVRGQAERHIEHIHSNPRTKLHHVYHPDLSRIERSKLKALPLTDVLEESSQSDAIIVSSPTPAHFNQLQHLTKFNGHILVEKQSPKIQRIYVVY